MNAHKICLMASLAGLLWAQQPVEMVKVVSKTVDRQLRLPGELSPYLKVDLYARVNGFVERVDVDRGTIVKEGQTLVLLSAPELTAQRAEAEAKVLAVEAQRVEAQAKLAAAESTYDRLRSASATPGAVAENEVIVARQAMEAARAAVQAVENSRGAAEDAARSVRELEGYLKVTAPFDGIITTRLVHPGALVGPATSPMLHLEQNSALRLVVAVPEADAGGILSGARVPFTAPAYPGETFYGVVARVSHSLDLKTRTMPVELDVRNPNGRLAPGMYAEVLWPMRRARASLLAPPSSVVSNMERTFVIRLRDGRAEYVDVVRGATVGDLIEVFGPLNSGDEIVRRGTDEIREGSSLSPAR